MTVLITGANRGIGKGLADSYRAQGEAVIGTAREPFADLRRLDVTDPASHVALADEIDVPIDLLICNAGVYFDKQEQLDGGYPADMWAATFAANVTGVFLTVQHMLPHLQPDACIAIISSQMASHTRAPGGSYIYRASKAAVLNVGRNLASDLKPKGIAVGIYHPGWVQTEMGGPQAAISLAECVQGLITRFDTLSLETTGCFETWDGEPHPY